MHRKINIAYVSHFDHMRMGGQKSMVHLIENLDRDRFTPFGICPRQGELSEKLESIGCRCFFVPLYSIKPKYIFKVMPITSKIKDIIKKYNIDILHPDYSADAFFCGLAKKGTNAKLIWHVRWNELFAKDRLHERLADGIIGVSEGAGERFKGNPEIYKKYRTIYNGVDCELFKPAKDIKEVRRKLGVPEDRLTLLFAGVLKEGKGVLEITKAMAKLKKESNVQELPQLYYIGIKGREETFEELQRIIVETELNENVKILPHQDNIQEWMQAADLLLIPSYEGHEGMPRVAYEAMACGTPVLGSDTSGVREAVTQNTGFLVKEKSYDDIANVIRQITDNPERLKNMRNDAKQRALEYFDIKKHARKVEDFYIKVLNNEL